MPAPRAVVAGLIATGVGLAAAALVSGLLAVISPLTAVAESIIALTPGPVAESLIHLVGQNDKPLLLAGVTVVLLGLGALAGVLASRNRELGAGLLVGLGAVGLLASVTRHAAGATAAAPALLGTAASVAALLWLTSASTAAPAQSAARMSRRTFLARAAVAAGAAVVAGGVGRAAAAGRQSVDAARQRLRLPTRPAPPPAGVEVGVAGVSPWVTPVADFYRIDTSLAPPLLIPDRWRLRVHGLVKRELDISLADLISRPPVNAWITLCCVSNPVGGPLISNGRWTGVRIADLLAEAGVRPGADAVLSRSVDGWTCGTPLSALTDGRDALLAYALDGKPLPVEHGFPVRMVVPGLYGFVSATKWVVDMQVTTFARFSAYWTQRGWSEQAPVKTSSRIDVPGDGASLPAGPVTVGGVAWAQHRGIRAVEVRVDNGAWQPATLGAQPTIDSWRQWRWQWQASKGEHQLSVRAIDLTGQVQTGRPADVVPNGATGWDRIGVQVS
jgi:DMSO/TMAO reductase YedYZ molybdopterin-dependent catalytic subunit